MTQIRFLVFRPQPNRLFRGQFSRLTQAIDPLFFIQVQFMQQMFDNQFNKPNTRPTVNYLGTVKIQALSCVLFLIVFLRFINI